MEMITCSVFWGCPLMSVVYVFHSEECYELRGVKDHVSHILVDPFEGMRHLLDSVNLIDYSMNILDQGLFPDDQREKSSEAKSRLGSMFFLMYIVFLGSCFLLNHAGGNLWTGIRGLSVLWGCNMPRGDSTQVRETAWVEMFFVLAWEVPNSC